MLLCVISSRTRRKSSPLLLEKAPATFSQMIYFGYCPFVFSLISLVILTASMNKPEREPSSPVCFPATLKSWQGLPKLIISTTGIFAPSICVMSPSCRASGKCRFAMSIQSGSISLTHTVLIPCRLAANGNPAIPSKRLPSVISAVFFIAISSFHIPA
ncbi:uncharacterized protein BN482_00927 [Clostridium sp. CAG:127]|nr:uncharacterized protein BN482_00927 [Clostridium sp. CAG:127]